MITDTNRIAEAIAKQRANIAAGVKVDGSPITADLVAFEKSMDNTVLEHFAYQEAQSRAFAMGRITYEEAQIIYNALGEIPAADGWAEGTDLATKVIVTSVVAQLLGAR